MFVGKCNVRKEIGDISEPIESVRWVGVLEPLIVISASHNKFEVVVGNRRCHAAKRIGLQKVPSIVKEMGGDEAMITSLMQNI